MIFIYLFIYLLIYLYIYFTVFNNLSLGKLRAVSSLAQLTFPWISPSVVQASGHITIYIKKNHRKTIKPSLKLEITTDD